MFVLRGVGGSLGRDDKNTGSRPVSELQTTSPRSFWLKPMAARLSVLKNVLSGRFNPRDDSLGRPSAKKAITARICTLYGDFSARSDAQFLVLGPGRLCTKIVACAWFAVGDGLGQLAGERRSRGIGALARGVAGWWVSVVPPGGLQRGRPAPGRLRQASLVRSPLRI